MWDWLGGVITSLWGSQEEKHGCSRWSKHQWCRVVHSCFFFLTENLSNKVAPKAQEYSLKMNNMSLLNFDSLPRWVVIVLPSLEYDYIRLLILTGFHFIFRHTAGDEEMKCGNVKPQEKTTLAAPFLTTALRSVKAWHQTRVFIMFIIYCSRFWESICSLMELYDIRFCCKAAVVR